MSLKKCIWKVFKGGFSMKLKINKFFIILIGVIFLFSGCEKEEVKNEEITTVKPFTVITKDYENLVSYSGYASSDELKRFSFELSGKIDEVLVEKGDMVKAGQVIATLDTTTIQMSIDKANQDIAIAKQDMAIANQDVQNAKQDIKNANQDVKNANQDVENANQDMANASETVKNANQNIDLAKNKIAQIDSSIKELNLGLDAERLTLEKAKTGIDAEKLNLEKIKETYTSSINKLQLNYDNALSTFENTKTLFDKGVCDKSAYDSAKLAFDTISEELTNTKQSMEKDISLQEKKIENLEHDYSLQETKIKDMENKIEQAQIQKEAAQISVNQAQTTSNQAKITSNKAEVASNKAKLAADKAKVTANKANIASNKAGIASNKAGIAAKEAEIALRQNTKYLSDSSLKSTINGYVVETPMKSGEVTSAGNPVVVVKSTTEIVNVAVPAEDYSKFKIGMNATLTQDDKTVYGKITSIDLYPDETTRTYNIEITPSVNNAFALGSLINVSISLDKEPSVFVPLSSIVDIDGIDYVYCITQNENNQNIVTSKEIKILSTDGENVRISGIESGTIIASNEVKNLRDNQTVNLKEGDSIEK